MKKIYRIILAIMISLQACTSPMDVSAPRRVIVPDPYKNPPIELSIDSLDLGMLHPDAVYHLKLSIKNLLTHKYELFKFGSKKSLLDFSFAPELIGKVLSAKNSGGDSIEFKIGIMPKNPGYITDTLFFNNLDLYPYLAIKCVVPNIYADSTVYNFGEVTVGEPKFRAFAINNASNDIAILHDIEFQNNTGAFSPVVDSLPIQILPHSFIQVKLKFLPSKAESIEEKILLKISSNGIVDSTFILFGKGK